MCGSVESTEEFSSPPEVEVPKTVEVPGPGVVLIATKRLLPCLMAVLAAYACSGRADSNSDSTRAMAGGASAGPNAPAMVRGTVTSVSASQIVLQSDTGIATVAVADPIRFYVRSPSDLSTVKENTFIGVTTVKQPDGSERATEMHVFPEELRGMGEGSRMMAQGQGGSGNRMTNGSVAQSRMTNGAASPSRMSNGNVSSTNGSHMVVQYAGGSQNVTVPPNTPVTELKLSSQKLAAGDQIVLLMKKAPDGSLIADMAVSTKR